MSVSDLELKTGTSLMAIGGFTGGDPSPTLAQFQQYVADGQVRYFLADSGRGGPPGHRTGTAADITTWVEKNFTKTDVGGTTVYDLQSSRAILNHPILTLGGRRRRLASSPTYARTLGGPRCP